MTVNGEIRGKTFDELKDDVRKEVLDILIDNPDERQKNATPRSSRKLKKKLSSMVLIKKHTHFQSLTLSSHLEQKAKDVFQGRIDIQCPTTAKVVRIFTSSTFTDTQNERNALMEHVYPRLKQLCQERGYQFQVVDMRWGVRDEATDDHMGTELCLHEIEMCQTLSTGPNFVTFLSHKYGYRAFPRVIETGEFEAIMKAIKSSDDKELISRWFLKDDNSVPSSYILQPISSHFPKFLSEDENDRKAARALWYEDSDRFQATIGDTAVKILPAEKSQKYTMSVTEAEVSKGIINNSNREHCAFWLHRNITDIDEQPLSHLLSRFKECKGSKEYLEQINRLLTDLKENRLKSILSQDNTFEYSIPWIKDKGLDPENEKHKDYLVWMCKKFESSVLSMLEIGIHARSLTELSDPLYEEIVQHTLFCQTKCESFHGRDGPLHRIKAYLESDESQPFVVHGESGCGKTSIMAMAAKQSWEWFHGKPTIILRFLGTTPDSSGIAGLLSSIIQQIYKGCIQRGISVPEVSKDLKSLKEEFPVALAFASEEQPLILILDSLDQLDPTNSARQLTWLPKELPPFVKLVVSTLPEKQYECFPKLQALIKDQAQFLEVPKLADPDVGVILEKWLSLRERTLTSTQKDIVVGAFQQCPLPLFLKLSFEEACRWKSYSLPTLTILQETVRESINALFARVEKMHGKVFVSRALGYLTIAQNGLTESELEDILSCDEAVLDEVYLYWTPPIRRLPPLLLVRMKADLDQYLVDRGADGVRVFNWYHRQFTEAASACYCTDTKSTVSLHQNLANYFSGIWANGNKKTYINKNGESVAADRLVAPQSLKFGSAYNLRKLNNLPWHLHLAQESEQLKEVLCNFEFLLAKVSANNVRSILDDLSKAHSLLPNDLELKMITEALWLSQDALDYDPKLLAPQLIGRLKPTENIQPFLKQCYQSSAPFLLPSKSILIQPGGQLIHSIPGHKKEITQVCMTSSGQHAVTISSDETAKIWNVVRGYLERTIEFDEEPEFLGLACHDSVILFSFGDSIKAYTFDACDLIYTISHDKNGDQFTVCCDSQKLVVLTGKCVLIYNAVDGTIIKTLENEPLFEKNMAGTEDQVNDSKTTKALEPSSNASKEDMPGPEKLLDQNERTASTLSNETVMSSKVIEYGASAKIAGSGRYVAVTDDDNQYVQVIDTEEGVFLCHKRFFENIGDDDDSDDDDLTVENVIVTPDDRHVIVSNYMDNNLHICDPATLEVIKVLPGNSDDYTDKFHITPSGRYLYFTNSDNLACWDLLEETKTDYIKESLELSDSATIDMKTVITVGSDGNVRIWDLTREATKSKPVIKTTQRASRNDDDEGEASSEADDSEDDDADVAETDIKVKNVIPMVNARYVAYIMREVTSSHRGFKLAVYDLAENKVVRRANMTERLASLRMINDTKGIVVTSTRKLKAIDLQTMTVTTVFKGLLSNSDDFCLLKNKTELVCKSRGRKNLKVYDVSTGEVIHIIYPGLDGKTKLNDIVTNDAGSVFAVDTEDDEPCILIYDATDYKLLKSLDHKALGTDYISMDEIQFSYDGCYFLLPISRTPPIKESDDKNLSYVVSVEIRQEGSMHHLVDEDDYEASVLSDSYDFDIDSNSFAVLDADHLIMGCEDAKIRIFNFRTGVLKKKLIGHISSVEVYTEPNADHFLSTGSGDEEQAFRLWDANTYECVASYKLDYQKPKIHLSNKGHLIVGHNAADILTWTLCGANVDNYDIGGDVPVLFPGEKLNLELNVIAADDTTEDPDDKDTDPAEEDSDMDTSDDDSSGDDSSDSDLDSKSSGGHNLNTDNLDFAFDDDDWNDGMSCDSQETLAPAREMQI